MNNEISAEYTKAVDLDRRIKTSAQLAQQSLYDMCMSFKEMRDSKLYKELGYSDFGEYCENETQINRQNVYKYINVVEKLPEEFVSPGRQIGIKKLYLLSTLSEDDRKEITENNDVAEMTKRELEAKIKELKIKADKADILSSRLDDMNKNCDRIAEQRDKAESKIRQLEAKVKEKDKDIISLEGTIEELESRPVEVAVQSDTTEIEKLNSIIKQTDLDWGKKYSELEEENIKLRQEDFRKHNAEIEQLKSEYERKLSEAENASSAEPVPDTKEVFKAYLSNAVDAVKRLLSFVQKYPGEKIFRDKTKELFNNINQNMEV